ncbi:Hypothetical protein I595_3472 [Croceitalea dokdonensis DOKDO 023]|uniref:Uncharacterized protein n=1 Tax=Croceitalea dokdonensis DOKDO 023 TaxID=1300341 RepID=A0A0P7ADL3_9FLAO|nr:hypothetical protein [Croceitalea dokdonensis]KPM30451.1 Hypothetical protein I595_3472 [Croceitalea dokdonensis DOKDO 023]
MVDSPAFSTPGNFVDELTGGMESKGYINLEIQVVFLDMLITRYRN